LGVTANGWVTLRDRTGFGIELDSTQIERQDVLTSL
jgi:L-alanine-DL-glutamate epimerase-like enolase superfamily enzyme